MAIQMTITATVMFIKTSCSLGRQATCAYLSIAYELLLLINDQEDIGEFVKVTMNSFVERCLAK